MFTLDAITAVASAAAVGEGFTAYRHGEDAASRYVVGGLATATLPVDASPAAVLEAARSLASAPEAARAETLGAWISGGLIYLDLGDTYATLEAAVAMGAWRGELAIWDRLEAREISC